MIEAELMMPMRTGEIRIHDAEGFEGMRKAGALVAQCLDVIAEHVQPGVTTARLDDLIRAFIYDNGAQSATIGYRGYEYASCISLNHVICHGMPSDRQL
ncbi:MAG: M24 family metallopeptidase, partial [Pseudomonadota bacterium]